jgi:peroxiredoxin family protein
LTELKQKIDTMKPGPDNKLSMIVFSGDMDKLLASMIIATGAVAMGMKVVLFFTFWGTAALRNPQDKPRAKISNRRCSLDAAQGTQQNQAIANEHGRSGTP